MYTIKNQKDKESMESTSANLWLPKHHSLFPPNHPSRLLSPLNSKSILHQNTTHSQATMASTALSTTVNPSKICTGKNGALAPTRALKSAKGLGSKPSRGVVCQATSGILPEDVPDMEKRKLLNLLLLGAISLPTVTMLGPYTYFFVPPGSGGGGGGIVAKDKLGNDVVVSDWLKTHGPNDRTLVQGLKGDPTYLVVETDKQLATYGVNAVCTHLGCVVPWNSNENKFICPCHGSQYNNQGRVVRGPAPLSLALVHADVDDDKVILVPWVETDFRTGEDPWWA